ncbi:hypothetical protein DFP72DRAFT_1048347 [Ephemerocybe angulata]|uniref:Uncharacterized protein n=1 Tax=Ephemerocybe angulata TaxID=980116 RepID=A0A8H6HR61_9AGAR|nr:hypothetical protein DFP72DRAFT_1048347 [Tulosesus angulatus]
MSPERLVRKRVLDEHGVENGECNGDSDEESRTTEQLYRTEYRLSTPRIARAEVRTPNATMAPTGEPKPSPKPEPIGSMAWVSLITICTLCGLFILWRRADALRKVVARSQLSKLYSNNPQIQNCSRGFVILRFISEHHSTESLP